MQGRWEIYGLQSFFEFWKTSQMQDRKLIEMRSPSVNTASWDRQSENFDFGSAINLYME